MEQWDGSEWSIMSSADLPGIDSVGLSGVSCLSAIDCLAVGNDTYGDDTVEGTIVEQWDGSTWSLVNSPNTAADSASTQLAGISCLSTSDCTAVGYFDSADGAQIVASTLVEQWDGTAWSLVTSPDPFTNGQIIDDDALLAVSCVSAADCTAVGYDGRAPLIEQSTG